MSEIAERISEFFGSALGLLFVVAYVLSIPLAFIFGDKIDLLISFFIPTYGFWVMLGSFF